jgi:hypothetical protein
MGNTTSVEQIEQAKPYRPDGPREKHADDAQRLLQRLRERGAEGITTGELIREGCCGLRPPNRIGDLRDAGHLIETRREGHGVFRFVLIRECVNPTERRHPRKKAVQKPLHGDWIADRVRTDGKGRPIQEKPEDCPLFAGASR